MNQLFFDLIRLSIGLSHPQNQSDLYFSFQPSVDEWRVLYKMAVKQSLVGVCFVGVRKYMEAMHKIGEKANIPQKVYHQWLGTALHIQQRNELINQRCIELQSKLSALGFKTSILKGQGISTHYGELKDFRQPGDIDVYVDCGRKKAIEYARSTGQDRIEWDYKHLHLNAFKETEVEIHYRPDVSCNPFRNSSLQKFWIQHKELLFMKKVDLGCGTIICPNDSIHIFFLIHHAYRHVISGGVGLRQIMDLYFALNNRNVSEDQRLLRWIEECGLSKISQTFMWIIVNVFGADEGSLPWGVNEKEGQFLLKEIMIGGNFGNADKRYGNANNRFAKLIDIFKRNMHLIRHYGYDAMFVPLYYIWHFCWKRFAKKY